MKMYVTYHWLLMFGDRSELRAVECSSKEQIHEVASDLCSLHGIRNVRINYCGRLPKDTTIITYEDYKKSYDVL